MSTRKIQNRPLRIFIFILAAGIIIYSWRQERRPVKEVANLEYRIISGTLEGMNQVIMIETMDRFFVLDSNFRSSFQNNDAEVVSRQEQLNLLAAYENLQYRGSFANPQQQTQQLRMSRELFNSLRFGQKLEITMDSKIRDSLLRIAPIQ